MKIRDWTTYREDGTIKVVADVDGFDLWYRVPIMYPPFRSADPFVAAALLPAMTLGEELTVEPGLRLSPRLWRSAADLQEIFHTWNPAFKVVPISATMGEATAPREGALSFFSAGADSMDTFFTHMDELSHVVFIHGFDFYGCGENYRTAVDRNSRFIAVFDRTLIPVETNFYAFGHRYSLSRIVTQGACLASVALLLGFATAYIPTSLTYDHLVPNGSHPLTDPLWSNEAVNVIHDGCSRRRTEKIRRIAASPTALAHLRVCEKDMNVNCGKCGKCLRTMATLRLLGIKETEAFPSSMPPLESIGREARRSVKERIFLRENIALPILEDDAETAALRRALKGAMRRADLRRAVRDLDAALLGGRLRRAVVPPDASRSVDIVPRDS